MQAIRLYYLPHRPDAWRVALALSAKGLPVETIRLGWFDDETYFALGIARHPMALVVGNEVLTDSLGILAEIDDRFPEGPALCHSIITAPAWQALLDWHGRVHPVLERLYAPLAPALRGIGDDPEALADFKAATERSFGLSLEELANDRYAGFAQFSRLTRLPELARHLAAARFYSGPFSIADCLLAADLHPLQRHDGVHLPIDLMYYLSRVETHCAIELGRDALSR